MTKKLIWRLSRLPEPSELQGLVKDKIITQEEAREILFKQEDDKSPKLDELKSEIEFLRKLVEKLSENKPTVLREYIYTYPIQQYHWYQPYYTWCSAGQTSVTNAVNTAGLSASAGDLQNSLLCSTTTGSGGNSLYYTSASNSSVPAAGINFSEIKTF